MDLQGNQQENIPEQGDWITLKKEKKSIKLYSTIEDSSSSAGRFRFIPAKESDLPSSECWSAARRLWRRRSERRARERERRRPCRQRRWAWSESGSASVPTSHRKWTAGCSTRRTPKLEAAVNKRKTETRTAVYDLIKLKMLTIRTGLVTRKIKNQADVNIWRKKLAISPLVLRALQFLVWKCRADRECQGAACPAKQRRWVCGQTSKFSAWICFERWK